MRRAPASDDAPASPDLDVVAWRFGQLELAGYPVEVAITLAERSDVDLHLACALLHEGASVDQAVRIVT